MIFGPEFYDDSEDEDIEPPSVPDKNVERLLKSISSMRLPNLRKLLVGPSHHSESSDNVMLYSSRLCWLLSSGDSKFKTLDIRNLYARDEAELVAIAKAFSSCTSMKKLSIDQLVLGQSVKSADVLMRALADLPKLETICIVFEAQSFWGDGNREARLGCYVEQSLSILQPRIDGIAVKQVLRFHNHQCPQLSN